MRKITKFILVLLIISIVSAVSSYAATNYAISATKISYSDNSNLGVDNVQAAIDGTCTKFSNQLVNLKKEVINEMYPKGSIYITSELKTSDAVAEKLGGTWEKYAQGRTLIGEGTGSDSNGLVKTFINNTTGGEYSHKLTISEIPSHSHEYTPSGNVSSTFKGITTTTDIAKASMDLNAIMAASTSENFMMITGGEWSYGYAINYSNIGFYKKDTSLFPGANHYHNFTPSGTVSSTFSGNNSVTKNVGNSNEFNVENPYIVVYIYRRIA